MVSGLTSGTRAGLLRMAGDIPDGYVIGLCRNDPETTVAHLYRGTFADPGEPMCARGWNRGGEGYSIFRGNVGPRGICRVCLRRAREGRDPVPSRKRKTRWI